MFKQVLCPTSACLQPPPSKKVKDLTLSDRMHEMLAATMAPAEDAGDKVRVGWQCGGCWSGQERRVGRARFTLDVLKGSRSEFGYQQRLTRIGFTSPHAGRCLLQRRLPLQQFW